MSIVSMLSATIGLAACASQPDHFYALTVGAARPSGAAGSTTTPVLLEVTLPSVVDRSEMVLSTADNGLVILDHQRWGAPLIDQVTQTLARDIEHERPGVMIADRRLIRGDTKPIEVRVQVFRMIARRATEATIEAHWRVIDPETHVDLVGSDSFTVPLRGAELQEVARGYSELLATLGQRLAAQLTLRTP